MKTKILFFIASIFLLNALAYGAEKYTDFREEIGKWNSIMVEYTSKLDKIENVDSATNICISLADKIKEITPGVKEIKKKYPELKQEPVPDELEDFIEEHISISRIFNQKLNNLMHMANEHTDNEAFQKAFGKLNRAVGKL